MFTFIDFLVVSAAVGLAVGYRIIGEQHGLTLRQAVEVAGKNMFNRSQQWDRKTASSAIGIDGNLWNGISVTFTQEIRGSLYGLQPGS